MLRMTARIALGTRGLGGCLAGSVALDEQGPLSQQRPPTGLSSRLSASPAEAPGPGRRPAALGHVLRPHTAYPPSYPCGSV